MLHPLHTHQLENVFETKGKITDFASSDFCKQRCDNADLTDLQHLEKACIGCCPLRLPATLPLWQAQPVPKIRACQKFSSEYDRDEDTITVVSGEGSSRGLACQGMRPRWCLHSCLPHCLLRLRDPATPFLPATRARFAFKQEYEATADCH